MELKTNYQMLKEDEKYIKKYIKRGVMSVHFLTWKTMYEYYLEERKDGKGKMQSYEDTAKYYNVDSITVRRMVYWMNSTE